MPKVQDIMSRTPMTCRENDPAFKAVEIMKRQNVGVVPVVDENNVCHGVVTEHDIVMQIVYNHQDAKQVSIRDIMSRDLLTCTMDEELLPVIQQMRHRKMRRIVVLDQNNHFASIISEADIAHQVGDLGKVEDLSRGVSSSAR
jgi:predicted transcriptional regulator